MEIAPETRTLANCIARDREAEVILVCGSVNEALVWSIIDQCEAGSFFPNVVLTVVTLGGASDAGYRLARYLQNKFERYSIFIPCTCKSTGTLMAIGAQEIIMGPFGEIGPLDVQFYKRDELDELSSGLVAQSAIKSLETTAIEMFEHYFLRLQRESQGLITLKTATDIAADLVSKLLNPVYSKINPFFIGENDLAMRIAMDYGERLARCSGNMRDADSLSMLVERYASHDFVIDRSEARTLFRNVQDADNDLIKLSQALRLPDFAKSYDENAAVGLVLTGGERSAPFAPIAHSPSIGTLGRTFHEASKGKTKRVARPIRRPKSQRRR